MKVKLGIKVAKTGLTISKDIEGSKFTFHTEDRVWGPRIDKELHRVEIICRDGGVRSMMIYGDASDVVVTYDDNLREFLNEVVNYPRKYGCTILPYFSSAGYVLILFTFRSR
jgi:hypothetical protein